MYCSLEEAWGSDFKKDSKGKKEKRENMKLLQQQKINVLNRF